MPKPFPTFDEIKDPDDQLDYRIDWNPRLNDEEIINTAVWSVVEGDIEITSSIIDGGFAVVWVRGGTPNQRQLLNCRITTSGGRQFDQRSYIDVRVK